MITPTKSPLGKTGNSPCGKINFKAISALSAILFAAHLQVGCLADSGVKKDGFTGPRDLVIGTGIDNGIFFTTTSLNAGTASQADAFEHDVQSAAFKRGSHLYITEPYSTNKVTRYDIDSDGKMTGPSGVLSFPGGSTASHVTFASDTKAYVSLGSTGKLAIINPTLMTVTGEIDLSKYAAGNDGSPDPTSAVVRDGFLFVALSQKKNGAPISAHDTGYVAVINIAVDTVVKVITDPRLASLGSVDDGNQVHVIDDNGDIYFYSNAVWGYLPGIKGGFLRIKAGETQFDTSYWFDPSSLTIEGVSGGKVAYGLTNLHVGSGIAYSMMLAPSLTSNPPDYVNDRNYIPVRINLRNKTIEKLPMSATAGFAAKGIVRETDGNILFAMATGTASGIFRYQPSANTASSTPILNISGSPFILFRVND
jgi:hypothetical protein